MATKNRTQEETCYVTFGVSGYSNVVRSDPVNWLSNYRTWGITPNYKVLRKTGGELPTNSYDQQRTTRTFGMSSFKMRHSAGAENTYWGCLGLEVPGQQILPTAYHGTLYNNALQKLPERVNGHAFNAALFMFEWHKTTQMVTDLSRDILHKFRGVNSSRRASNIWLEYRYGWRLAVMDIYDALCTLHDIRNRKPKMRVRATSEATYYGTYNRLYPYSFERKMVDGPKNDMRVDWVDNWFTTVTVRFQEYSDVVSSLQQLGITNPFALAWEVIPYSFVIDWIIPVSDYLSTLDTWVGKQFVGGSISYGYERINTCTPYNIRNPLNPAWQLQTGSHFASSKSTRRFYKRVPLLSFPTASLPDVQLNLNASRMIDAVSLVKQRFGRNNPFFKPLYL